MFNGKVDSKREIRTATKQDHIDDGHLIRVPVFNVGLMIALGIIFPSSKRSGSDFPEL